MEMLVKAYGLWLNLGSAEVMSTAINNQPSTAFPHERLEVWQLAKTLAGRVYSLTSSFPKEENLDW